MQFFLHISDVSTNYVWHCSKKKKKSLPIINLQRNNEFIGNEPGEKELIVIPDKGRKSGPHPNV